jgi:ankyrin repeat protein
VVKRLREASDTGSTRSHLLEILDSIPKELEDLFAKVVTEPDAPLVSLVQWILFSKRRLSIPELYFAIRCSIGGTITCSWNVDEIDEESMTRYLLHVSRGLVECQNVRTQRPARKLWSDPSGVQDTWATLLFIHESVREYFLSGGLASMARHSLHETAAVGHAMMAEGCVSYLELAVNQPAFWTLSRLMKGSGPERQRAESRLPFVDYASANFLHHAEVAFASDLVDLTLLERAPLQSIIVYLGINNQWYKYARLEPEHPSSLLDLMLRQGCSHLARALLAQTSDYTRAQRDETEASCKHTRLAKPDLGKFSLLHSVISRGRKDLVASLLEYGADVDMPSRSGNPDSPLRFAALGDRHEIVRILLQHGARTDTADNQNILHVAAKYSRKEIVQYLLEKIDVNLANDLSQTALHLTAERQASARDDDVTIARILIAAGADMEAADEDGNTVLIKAAGSWQFRLVQFLLEKGACINARNHDRCTALHAAVDVTPFSKFRSRKRPVGEQKPMLEAMLESLLDPGSDMSVDDRSYSAMFDAANTAGHFEILIFLVRHGVSETVRSFHADDWSADESSSSVATPLAVAMPTSSNDWIDY